MPTAMDLRLLLRHPVEFVVGETPAESRFVFHTPDGDQTATANEAIGPRARASARCRLTVPSAPGRPRRSSPCASWPAARSARPTPTLFQLQSAGAAIGPNPGAGQTAVNAFMKALEVDAPAAASTPQRTAYVSPHAAAPRTRETTFSWSLMVSFLEHPTPEQAAVVRLRVHPRSGSFAAFDANDLFNGSAHPMAQDAREPTAAMLQRLGQLWPAAATLRDEHSRGAVTVSPDARPSG
ncbi:hypothetical protein [Aeromicrobium sp. UC242_57]|uniref:hypothetical protein n=1 Tax=Aeromicrobium sp. UC242_57 TaxID=3374624 RepID=UPI0037A68C9B